MHPVGKAPVVLDGRDARVLLIGEQRFQARGRSFDRLDKQPERSAVDFGALHVVEVQTMIAEKPRQRRHRKVAEVLVVDGVELAFLDQVDNVGRLDDGDPVGLQQGA